MHRKTADTKRVMHKNNGQLAQVVSLDGETDIVTLGVPSQLGKYGFGTVRMDPDAIRVAEVYWMPDGTASTKAHGECAFTDVSRDRLRACYSPKQVVATLDSGEAYTVRRALRAMKDLRAFMSTLADLDGSETSVPLLDLLSDERIDALVKRLVNA